MFILIGLGVVLACVFGSFVASGGAIGPLLSSMPFELLTILGAAIGTFLMANSIEAVKHVPAGIKRAMKGSQYGRQDYIDMLGLLFHLTRLASMKGLMALESHIEEPATSTIFGAFPKIRDNPRICAFICDYLRMAGMNVTDPYQMDEVMGNELKKTSGRTCIFHMPCNLFQMRCQRSASSRPCSASSRPWRPSASRPLFWGK